jgi:hypothetical protein
MLYFTTDEKKLKVSKVCVILQFSIYSKEKLFVTKFMPKISTAQLFKFSY